MASGIALFSFEIYIYSLYKINLYMSYDINQNYKIGIRLNDIYIKILIPLLVDKKYRERVLLILNDISYQCM